MAILKSLGGLRVQILSHRQVLNELPCNQAKNKQGSHSSSLVEAKDRASFTVRINLRRTFLYADYMIQWVLKLDGKYLDNGLCAAHLVPRTIRIASVIEEGQDGEQVERALRFGELTSYSSPRDKRRKQHLSEMSVITVEFWRKELLGRKRILKPQDDHMSDGDYGSNAGEDDSNVSEDEDGFDSVHEEDSVLGVDVDPPHEAPDRETLAASRNFATAKRNPIDRDASNNIIPRRIKQEGPCDEQSDISAAHGCHPGPARPSRSCRVLVDVRDIDSEPFAVFTFYPIHVDRSAQSIVEAPLDPESGSRTAKSSPQPAVDRTMTCETPSTPVSSNLNLTSTAIRVPSKLYQHDVEGPLEQLGDRKTRNASLEIARPTA
ncbi:MAG: hypothetical protein M1828_001138 [Chrysothrix sp. TS-e1954]|nr:MAG: hypothetical protein M1828_001138 [Chrysothrix sp. TS-e1954]